jgi:hypothetical protein
MHGQLIWDCDEHSPSFGSVTSTILTAGDPWTTSCLVAEALDGKPADDGGFGVTDWERWRLGVGVRTEKTREGEREEKKLIKKEKEKV